MAFFNLYEEDCNFAKHCSKAPIPQRCLKYCMENTLRNATIEEKMLILGLSSDIANKIFTAYNKQNIRSFDDLVRYLNKKESEEIENRFLALNQYQLDYFQKSREERDEIITVLRNVMRDRDSDLVI